MVSSDGLQSLLRKMEAGLDCLRKENLSICRQNHELPPQKQSKFCFGGSYGQLCTKSYLPVVRATAQVVRIDFSLNLPW